MKQTSYKIYLLAIICILFLLPSPHASAQFDQGDFTYGGEIGGSFNFSTFSIRVGPQVGYMILDPLMAYVGLSYEYGQVINDKSIHYNVVGGAVGLLYEFVTFDRYTNSNGMLLSTGFGVNYIIPADTSNYTQVYWPLGIGYRNELSQRGGEVYVIASWNLWQNHDGGLWESEAYIPR